MTIKSIRILCRIDLPTGTARIWDGSGPYLDGDGEVWVGAGLVSGLDRIEQVQGDEVLSTLFVQVENRFNLRMLKNGAVLSDVDQRARSAVINPGADPDRFAERVSLLADKTIAWPKLTS